MSTCSIHTSRLERDLQGSYIFLKGLPKFLTDIYAIGIICCNNQEIHKVLFLGLVR